MEAGTGVATAAADEQHGSILVGEPAHSPAAPEATTRGVGDPGLGNDDATDVCPVQETIRIVGRKWHLILLWELSRRPAGFNDLKQRARGISAKMLSQSLNDMEQEHLVVRDVVTERPLRVMYRLTERAEDLAGIFDVMKDWGERNGVAERATTG